jgi:hypothetical protein
MPHMTVTGGTKVDPVYELRQAAHLADRRPSTPVPVPVPVPNDVSEDELAR